MYEEVSFVIDRLKTLKIEDARDYILELRGKETGNVKTISYLASDVENGAGLLVYTLLVDFLLIDDGHVLWHEIARDVLSNNLCH